MNSKKILSFMLSFIMMCSVLFQAGSAYANMDNFNLNGMEANEMQRFMPPMHGEVFPGEIPPDFPPHGEMMQNPPGWGMQPHGEMMPIEQIPNFIPPNGEPIPMEEPDFIYPDENEVQNNELEAAIPELKNEDSDKEALPEIGKADMNDEITESENKSEVQPNSNNVNIDVRVSPEDAIPQFLKNIKSMEEGNILKNELGLEVKTEITVGEPDINQQVQLTIKWDASMYGADLKEGDFFNVLLPKEYIFTYGEFDIPTPDYADVIAKAVITPEPTGGGNIKVTFTKYVEEKDNIKGEVFLEATVAPQNIPEVSEDIREELKDVKTEITVSEIVAPKENTPEDESNINQQVKLKMKWDASMYAGLKEGDFFNVLLPKEYVFAYGEFDIPTPDYADVIAKAVITPEPTGGGNIKVTFTNTVEGKEDVKGEVFLEATVTPQNIPEVPEDTKEALKDITTKIIGPEEHNIFENIPDINKPVQLTIEWDASMYGAGLKEGDFFNVTLPKTYIFTDREFDIPTPDGTDVIAKAVVTPESTGGGNIKVTFTKAVEGKEDVKGEFVLEATVALQNLLGEAKDTGPLNCVDVKITKFEIKDKDGNTIPPGTQLGYWSTFRLEMDWDASSYGKTLKEGDYFIVTLPNQFKFPTQPAAVVDFPLYAPDGTTVIANAHVDSNGEAGGGTVKVTFTDYVVNRENIHGDMYLGATFAHHNINAGQTNTITVSIGGNSISIDVPIGPKPTLNNEVFNKWGEKVNGNENQAQWVLRINHKKGNFNNVVIKDELFVDSGSLPPGIHYLPDTFELKEVEMDEFGAATKIIKTYNYNQLKNHITFSNNNTKFEFKFSQMLGNTSGKQFMMVYKSTYIPQLKLKNKGSFTSNEENGSSSGYFLSAQAGGGGQGDLNQKIKIIKIDADDNQTKLANAKFKITKVADGSSFELTTDANGEAVSPKLDPGKYKIKEIEAPLGYILDGTEHELTIVGGEAIFYVVKNEKKTIDVEGEKTWNDN
ncbi:Ig-like domain-containing protein, partial [Peptoniphilus mikwangii]|uniref:Ig-like domain-containing protein n=1 Tax=Peptoniphilus mikwangii TaxID=1354300 RepID=UPI001F27B3CF